ncbi:MAG: hypothetical protein J0H50_06700 [Xanthomonadales bacterium]|nr:hypothetical protein [Xanthomonadales bacterium]
MNEEAFNTSVRKFLKTVGVTSQQQLEAAVQAAIASGTLKGHEDVAVKIELTSAVLGKPHVVEGTLKLE